MSEVAPLVRHMLLCEDVNSRAAEGRAKEKSPPLRQIWRESLSRVLRIPTIFGADPLAVEGRVFRIKQCVFPRAGLYWIQFRCHCGCGQATKGGIFLPGHDAKLRAAIEESVGGLLALDRFIETAREFVAGRLSAEEYQHRTKTIIGNRSQPLG